MWKQAADLLEQHDQRRYAPLDRTVFEGRFTNTVKDLLLRVWTAHEEVLVLRAEAAAILQSPIRTSAIVEQINHVVTKYVPAIVEHLF